MNPLHVNDMFFTKDTQNNRVSGGPKEAINMALDIQSFRQKLEQKKGQRQQIANDLAASQKAIKNLEYEIEYSEKAQAIIAAVAKSTQEELEYRITEPVSLALAAVYDNPYKASANFVLHGRGTTECFLGFERSGNINDMYGVGGGVVDIAGFGYRLGSLSLISPTPRNMLVLDEPFRFVSRDKMPLAGQMLLETTKDPPDGLGLQILLVSHIPELIKCADKVFEIEIRSGISHINQTKQ